MDCVGVAMGTELFDFKSSGGIATVFASGIAGNAIGALVCISATFSAFQGNGNADAFFACHNFYEVSGFGPLRFTHKFLFLHILS